MPQSYPDFALEALDRLSAYEAEHSLPSVAHALPHWIVDLRREPNGEHNSRVTHGQNELGIDGYVIYDETDFTIFQCKSPDRERLEHPSEPVSFDESVTEELLTGARYLCDPSANPDAVNAGVSGLKTKYQAAKRQFGDSVRLTAVAVVLGAFTAEARTKIDQVIAPEYAALDVQLEVVDWKDLSRETLPAAGAAVDVLTLTVGDPKTELLDHGDFAYVLAKGIDLVHAYERHGLALFDLNVRSQITRSRVNFRIRETLKDEWGRRNFHHLNNGLLVICDKYESEASGGVRLISPQIVNGCQTVTSLSQAYDGLPSAEQAEFEQSVYVQTRVLVAEEGSKLLDKVVVASNDQNKMNPRNLRSNTDEQLTLQRALESISPAWFYQRKDGEWESHFQQLKRIGQHTGLASPIAKFKIPGERGSKALDFRCMDNEAVARAWYACLGESHRMVMGTVKLFETESPLAKEDETRTLYDDIFRSQPSGAFWREFPKATFTLSREHLSDSAPGHYQLLLAYALSRYVAVRKLSAKEVYDRAIARAKENGTLGSTYTEEAAREAIAQDFEYGFESLLSNTDYVLVELMWHVLSMKYGRLDGQNCRSILLAPEMNGFSASGFRTYIDPSLSDGALLWPIYAFVCFCYLQVYGVSPQIRHGARGGRSEMAKRASVNSIRRNSHDYFAGPKRGQLTILDHDWKPAGLGIDDILPALPQV